MQPTIDFMRSKFCEFNAIYFNNQLKVPFFEISHTKKSLGDLITIGDEYTIRLTDYYVQTKKNYEETLLHEMIHLYQRQILNTSGHGDSFIEKAYEINSKGKYNVEIKTDVSVFKTKKEHYVAVYQTYDNKYFLFGISPKNIYKWLNCLETCSQAIRYFYFKSSDEQFAGLPACRSICRGYYISESEAKELRQKYNCKIYEKLTAGIKTFNKYAEK